GWWWGAGSGLSARSVLRGGAPGVVGLVGRGLARGRLALVHGAGAGAARAAELGGVGGALLARLERDAVGGRNGVVALAVAAERAVERADDIEADLPRALALRRVGAAEHRERLGPDLDALLRDA